MKLRYVVSSFAVTLLLSSCGKVSVSTLESISLSGNYQTEYYVGDSYNSTGLVVTAHYSDETTIQVADYTVSGFDSSSVGSKTITVTYQQKTASYTVNVLTVDPTHLDIIVNVNVSGISSYSLNHSHIYLYQKFASKEWSYTPLVNASGNLWTAEFLQVQVGKTYEYNAYYGDSQLPDLDNGKNVIAGSSKTLTVNKDQTVYEVNATFNVVEPTAITLDSVSLMGSYKTVYKIGESFDTTGLVVVAHYSDNSEKIITNYQVSGFDSSQKGSCIVTISYTEDGVKKVTTFTVTITNLLKSIAIKTKPTKLVYEYGDEFSQTGLQVTATYEDDTTKDVADFTVSGYDKNTIGTQIITVSYTEDTITKEATFTIEVKNSVASIEVVSIPNKVEYLPGDELDTTGLVVIGVLKNGTKTYLESSSYTLSGFESLSAGEKTVVVKYNDDETITTSFTLTVKKPDVSNVKSIEITTKPTKLKYFLDEKLDLSGMVVTATFVNEDTEAVLGYDVEGFDSTSFGKKTITISYGVGVDTFEIEVVKNYENIQLNLTVSGLDEYVDSYSNIYIEHNFGIEENASWLLEKLTQDETNPNLWTIEFENIESEKYYNFNFYFGDSETANKTYGKNIIDDECQFLRVVRGTTSYYVNATFKVSRVEKEFDLVIDPTIKTSSTAEAEELDSETYLWAWDNVNNETSLYTKQDDGWHKHFAVTMINGKAKLTFNAVLGNTDAYAPNPWVYQMGEYENTTFTKFDGGYTFIITPETTATVTYNALFNGQPTYDTYELRLTINVEGEIADAFANMKFIFNNDDSETYNWDTTISNEKLTTYTFTKTDLPLNLPLYFKIYIYEEGGSKYRIGGQEGTNFSLVPYKAVEQITITFTYGETVGACEIAGRQNASMTFANQTTTVYGNPITITPTFTDSKQHTFSASYEGNNIRIDYVDGDLQIVGLKANTITKVDLVADTGDRYSFTVTIPVSEYEGTWTRDRRWVDYTGDGENDGEVGVYEGWFTEHSVDEISNMSEDFMNGIDISSVKALYDNGTKFYNTDGVEQSLFYILKENGVNWIRMKLWVDPYTETGVSYGGGSNDLDTDLWIAHEAKAAGLNVLLDFHYSDYWTDPATQIIPKAWADATSADDMANRIQTYTTNVLTAFRDEGCLPEMVQLGNEISSGMLKHTPGSGNTFNAYGEPSYATAKGNADESIAGAGGSTASDNMKKYINAGATGVNAVDSSIKKIVHWAKGGAGISGSIISTFFNSLTNVDYDYAAISFYPFYCFDSISEASTILSSIDLSKPWLIAETSYPFSGLGYVYENDESVTNLTISKWYESGWKWGGSTSIHTEYEYNVEGQANLIHDLTELVVNNNGTGIFYWEGAWVPNKDVGWAGVGSTCSWSNQGFFSYDGKAISNINIFKQMSPHI